MTGGDWVLLGFTFLVALEALAVLDLWLSERYVRRLHGKEES